MVGMVGLPAATPAAYSGSSAFFNTMLVPPAQTNDVMLPDRYEGRAKSSVGSMLGTARDASNAGLFLSTMALAVGHVGADLVRRAVKERLGYRAHQTYHVSDRPDEFQAACQAADRFGQSIVLYVGCSESAQELITRAQNPMNRGQLFVGLRRFIFDFEPARQTLPNARFVQQTWQPVLHQLQRKGVTVDEINLIEPFSKNGASASARFGDDPIDMEIIHSILRAGGKVRLYVQNVADRSAAAALLAQIFGAAAVNVMQVVNGSIPKSKDLDPRKPTFMVEAVKA